MKNEIFLFGGIAGIGWPACTSSYVRRTKVEGSHQFGSLLLLSQQIKEREHRFVPSLQSREKKIALANAQNNNKINRSKSSIEER